MDERVALRMDAWLGRHLDPAFPFLPEGRLEKADDRGHVQGHPFDIGPGQIEQLRRAFFSHGLFWSNLFGRFDIYHM